MSKETKNNHQWLVSYIDDLLDGTPDTELESVVQLSNAVIDKTDALHTPDIDQGNNQQLFIEKYTKKKAIKSQIDSTRSEAEIHEQKRVSCIGTEVDLSPVMSSLAPDAYPSPSPVETSASLPSGSVVSKHRAAYAAGANTPSEAPVAAPQPSSKRPIAPAPRYKPVEQDSDRKQRVAELLRQATLQETKQKVEKKLKQKEAILDPKPTKVKQKRLAPAVQKTQTVVPESQAINTRDCSPASSADWQNGRPAWAHQQFEVLLFSVSQLTLAVPLITLGQIQKISNNLTPLFGQADWFMGVLPTDYGKIRCVDTALFVMPERYRPECRSQYRFVITIDGFPWGLAVDEVKQPITLQSASVNWRSSRSKRPWLAGTIKEHMCALIDVPTLGELLADQDKNRR